MTVTVTVGVSSVTRSPEESQSTRTKRNSKRGENRGGIEPRDGWWGCGGRGGDEGENEGTWKDREPEVGSRESGKPRVPPLVRVERSGQNLGTRKTVIERRTRTGSPPDTRKV